MNNNTKSRTLICVECSKLIKNVDDYYIKYQYIYVNFCSDECLNKWINDKKYEVIENINYRLRDRVSKL